MARGSGLNASGNPLAEQLGRQSEMPALPSSLSVDTGVFHGSHESPQPSIHTFGPSAHSHTQQLGSGHMSRSGSMDFSRQVDHGESGSGSPRPPSYTRSLSPDFDDEALYNSMLRTFYPILI